MMDWGHIITIANMMLSLVIAVVVFWVNTKTSKIDKLEEKLDQKAEQIINARFAAIESRMRDPFKSLDLIVARIEKRLERGDEAFGAQAERSHSLDKKIAVSEADVKLWVRENFATIGDLQALRVAMQEIQIAIGSKKHGH